MKPERWLRLSLLLNLLLLLAAVWVFTPSPPHPKLQRDGSAIGNPLGVGRRGDSASGPVLEGRDSKEAAWHWSQLDGVHWPAYRDGLRAIGCPESKVHEILEPLVYRQFAAEARAAAVPFSLRYWEMVLGTGSISKEEFEKSSHRIEAGYRAALDTLFSTASPGNPDPEEGSAGDPVDATVRFLPPEVQSVFVAAQRRHQQQLNELQTSPQGRGTNGAVLMHELNQQWEAELAEMLTPEERREFRDRSSPSASLRFLEGIELSQTEIADLVALRERLGDGAPAAKEATVALLGPERAAALERAQDSEFKVLSEMGQQFSATPTAITALWSEQRRAETMSKEIAGDVFRPPSERAALLETVRDSVQARAAELLGTEGLAAWKRWRADWLRQTFAVPPDDPLAELPVHAP